MAEGGDESDPLLDRRQYVALVGASSVALAGCSGGGDGGGDGGRSDDDQQSNDEESGDQNTGDSEDSDDSDQQSDDEAAEPANFALSVSVPLAVDRGGEVQVDITVENTGGQEATQSITATLGGNTVTTEPATLGPGEQQSLSRTITAPDDTGEYDLTVTSDDDSVTKALTVEVGTTPQTFSGTGQGGGETVQIEGGLVVTEATHGGTGTFEVSLQEVQFGTLVRETGGYDGAEARFIDEGEYTLSVVADGEWEVTIRQPRADSGESVPVTYTGTSSEVVGPVELPQNGTARFSHTGQEAVQVTVYTEQRPAGPILFRSFGEFEDDTVYAGGLVSWIDVDADGNWTLELE